MSGGKTLETAVALGYGDLINIAFELEDGQPVWDVSERDPNAKWLRDTTRQLRAAGIEIGSSSEDLDFPTLFVCTNGQSGRQPLTQLSAGHVQWRTKSDGYWEPSLPTFEFGTTVNALAVRVLGTLATSTIGKLLWRDILHTDASTSSENPVPDSDMDRLACSIVKQAMAQQREPATYAIPTDLSLAEDPTPYLARV